jgi:hypothetical protein
MRMIRKFLVKGAQALLILAGFVLLMWFNYPSLSF